MYNGNTVIEREIRDKYNEVFKIIGEKVGLRKLTYETYLGLNESDTRRKAVDRLLEKTLRLRDDADVCACVDTINKDVKREDKIDKIDSFFKLGEKIYPKEEKKEEVVTPTPDRLFEVNDEEEHEIEQEEPALDKDESRIDNLKEDISNKKNPDVSRMIGVGAIGVINVAWLSILLPPAIISGNLLGIALALSVPAITVLVNSVATKNKDKNKTGLIKKILKALKGKDDDSKELEKEKIDTKTESPILNFENDLDNPIELDFRDDIKEEENDKPLEADAISESPTIEERSMEKKPVGEMTKVETELSTPDSVVHETEPTNKKQNNGQTSSWTRTIKPNFEVNDNSKKNSDLGGNKMNTNDYKKKLVDLKNRLEYAKKLKKEDWIKELEAEIVEVEKIINERESKKQEITDNKEKLVDLRSRLENAKKLKKEDWIKELEGEISVLDKTVNDREQVKQDFIDKKERLEYLKGQLNYYKGLGRKNWVEDTEKEIEELSKQIEEHDYDLDYPNEEVSRGK